MHVDRWVLERLESVYGRPRELRLAVEMGEREFALCRRAADRGRTHDVTLFILRDDEIAVIRKWSYPPDLFRPPSGGVEPGEPFEIGAAREAYEETGLHVALDRYLVRVLARFTHFDEALDWQTHVFSARWLGGEIVPIDTHEIAEARWATCDELRCAMRDRLLAHGSPGFRYRVVLQDAAFEELR
jgi:8-oxo-dGTP pyrophosphatase MutT (NUDIX family)